MGVAILSTPLFAKASAHSMSLMRSGSKPCFSQNQNTSSSTGGAQFHMHLYPSLIRPPVLSQLQIPPPPNIILLLHFQVFQHILSNCPSILKGLAAAYMGFEDKGRIFRKEIHQLTKKRKHLFTFINHHPV